MSSNFLTNIRLGTFGKTIHSVFCLLFRVAEAFNLPSNNPPVLTHCVMYKRGPRLVD